jgi:hypothetical protein
MHDPFVTLSHLGNLSAQPERIFNFYSDLKNRHDFNNKKSGQVVFMQTQGTELCAESS